MKAQCTRRRFITGAGAVAAVSAFSGSAFAAAKFFVAEASPIGAATLYPPMDLSYFDVPISAAPTQLHFGYASITWDGKDREAIEDISALGFAGIQLRANAVGEFGSPSELRDQLQRHHLTFIALSSGSLSSNPDTQTQEIAKHAANAKFLHDAGGLYLQMTDQKPKGRPVTANDFRMLGKALTEIGRQSADLGIKVGYHNHMGSMGEAPEDVDRILDSTDPRYVKLELDVAHYVQGGGDPVKAIERYRDRLLFLHLKDVEALADNAGHSYRFVELGRGRVDFPAIFAALNRIQFRGWTVVELDRVPDKARTPKESAMISKKYLEERIGIRV